MSSSRSGIPRPYSADTGVSPEPSTTPWTLFDPPSRPVSAQRTDAPLPPPPPPPAPQSRSASVSNVDSSLFHDIHRGSRDSSNNTHNHRNSGSISISGNSGRIAEPKDVVTPRLTPQPAVTPTPGLEGRPRRSSSRNSNQSGSSDPASLTSHGSAVRLPITATIAPSARLARLSDASPRVRRSAAHTPLNDAAPQSVIAHAAPSTVSASTTAPARATSAAAGVTGSGVSPEPETPAFRADDLFFLENPRTPSDHGRTSTAPAPHRRTSPQPLLALPSAGSVASDDAVMNLNSDTAATAPVQVVARRSSSGGSGGSHRHYDRAEQKTVQPVLAATAATTPARHRRGSLHSEEKQQPKRRRRRSSSDPPSTQKSGSDDYADDEYGPRSSEDSYSDYGYDDSLDRLDDDTQPDKSRRNSRQQSRSSSFSAAPRRDVSGLDQLFAVVARQAQQLFRTPCSLIMEIVVPLIFVAVTIILWAIWGSLEFPSQSFVPATTPELGFYANPEAMHVCVNLTAYPAALGGLPPCSNVSYQYVCDGDFKAVPLPAHTICRNAAARFSTLTYLWLRSLIGNLSRVPSLDTIITYQFISQLDIGPLNQMGAMSVSKLYPTTAFNAIVSSGTLYFVGPQTFTSGLIAHMRDLSSLVTYVSDPNVYATVAEARRAAPANSMIWAIVEIKTASATGLDLVLHMNNSALPSFGTIDDTAYPGGALTETAELYLASGFSTLQQVVTEFYLNYYWFYDASETQMMASFGYPSYVRVPLLLVPREILPLVFGIAFLYTVSQQVKRIVLEKELRIREAMLIMGLKQWTLYVSDFIIQLIILVIISVLAATILKLSFCTHGDPLILLLIFILFAITTVPLAGIIAAFFSKARLASLVAPVIYFILVIPMFAMTNAHGAIITGFSIFSPSAFCAALQIYLTHEVGTGFGGSNFHSSKDNPTLAVILGMLAADFVIYYLLMLYLDAVMPKEWGTPKHPLFFIIDPFKCIFCHGKTKAQRLEGGPDGRAENGVFETTSYVDDVVSFDGLRKEYSRGGKKFTAVNNFYWGMKEGEISVLLGHNGAGKTTLLNMMTGMIKPDEGDCYIYGHSVRTELSQVRQELGFCPQHNILWSDLTCRDHLEFYGRIKGLKGWELEDAVCKMLYETDMVDKMDQPSRSLSGGMKRKLSIAISFVGGSRLVFLDEPTAGLDVAARRYVWELLLRMAQRHTILLTTHYMDEADLLGSRIGIMSQGRLKCTGSSLFLKSRLGVGYNIVISIDPELDHRVVDEFVLSSVEGSTMEGRNGTELSYLLPSASVDQFPAFLNEIDSSQRTGIRGYALSATTLEEVFLKVSEEDLDHRKNGVSTEQLERIWTCELVDSVWAAQMKAMLSKRLWCALRDRRMQCFQVICPVLCILIAMLLTLIKFGIPQQLVMDYAMFTESTTPVLLTAGCDDLWGESEGPAHVIRNETHFQTGGMLSDFALDTWNFHKAPRFGGLSCNEPTLVSPYVTTEVNNVHFINTTSHHQAGIALATYYDQVVKQLGASDRYIKHTAAVLDKPDPSNAMTFIFVGTLIMIPMSFLPSNAVAWVVKERECGARHLQKLSGLNFCVYWVANYIFDMAAYLLSMCLCILIFACFNRKEFIGNDRVGATFTIFLLYGLTSTVMAYAVSFAFKEHSNAQMVVMAVGLVLGFLLNVIVFVLQLRNDSGNAVDITRYIFRIVPSYCVGEGIINLLMLQSNVALGYANGPWDMDQLGWAMVYLAAEVPVFWIVTLLLDHPQLGQFLQRRHYSKNCEPVIAADEDPDVTEERMGVYAAEKGQEDTSDVVRVVDLQKNYGKGKLAVKGITFSLFPGEVFGFLGTNGAGKTTTISMLCQQFLPSAGRAFVCGYDVVEDSKEALRCIGYCPQFDATLDLLTVEEQLEMYASIRGVAEHEKAALVDALCTLCELTMYRKTVSSELSGGNRRKLSVAMSLVGGPQVLFLDEPSAGMDPVARRGMWTAIQRAAKHCSVVLTTHHLEEVEALADMVAIMVKGYIRCIGDKVHLKNKFGSAFEVSVRIESSQYAARVVEFFESVFPSAVQNEGDGCRYVYRLPRDRKFGDIFRVLQANKERLHITDYSVSQTSIEQVFLRVTEGSKHL